MKGIVTVIGRDHTGIIASVSGFMTSQNINILDISQTIMSDYFTMIMLVDLSAALHEVAALRSRLEELGAGLKVQISLTHQDVFDAMHRI